MKWEILNGLIKLEIEVSIYQKRLQNGQDLFGEEGQEALTLQECMAERMILGLRLQEGVNFSSFRNDFGVDLRDIYRDILERYKHRDVFVVQGEYLRLNSKFSFVANGILEEFVGGLKFIWNDSWQS